MKRYWYISARIVGDHGIKFTGTYHWAGYYPQLDFVRSRCAEMHPDVSPDSQIYIDSVVRVSKEEYERNVDKGGPKIRDIPKTDVPKREFTIIDGGLL